MKIFFYTLRPYDELPCAEKLRAETGIDFAGCEEYPTLENAALAAGCDAVSMTPCDMGPAMVRRFHELGVKYICCRSIGYEHVSRETARELGMRVANVDYPPRGVANFAIMLMLMSLQDRPRPVRLHGGRHRHRADRADGAGAPVRLRLQAAGL